MLYYINIQSVGNHDTTDLSSNLTLFDQSFNSNKNEIDLIPTSLFPNNKIYKRSSVIDTQENDNDFSDSSPGIYNTLSKTIRISQTSSSFRNNNFNYYTGKFTNLNNSSYNIPSSHDNVITFAPNYPIRYYFL